CIDHSLSWRQETNHPLDRDDNTWLFAAHSDRHPRALVWQVEDSGARSLKRPCGGRAARPFVERRPPMRFEAISTCCLATALEVHRRLRRLALGTASVALA